MMNLIKSTLLDSRQSLSIAKNNLATERETAVKFGVADQWDLYASSISRIDSLLAQLSIKTNPDLPTGPIIPDEEKLEIAKMCGVRYRTGEGVKRFGHAMMVTLMNRLVAQTMEENGATHVAVLAEREACAMVCDKESHRAMFNYHSDLESNKTFWNGAEQLVSGCADTIRQRNSAILTSSPP